MSAFEDSTIQPGLFQQRGIDLRREVSALERKPRSRYGRNLWLAIGAGLRLGLPLDFRPSVGAITFAAVLLALVLAVAYVALTA